MAADAIQPSPREPTTTPAWVVLVPVRTAAPSSSSLEWAAGQAEVRAGAPGTTRTRARGSRVTRVLSRPMATQRNRRRTQVTRLHRRRHTQTTRLHRRRHRIGTARPRRRPTTPRCLAEHQPQAPTRQPGLEKLRPRTNPMGARGKYLHSKHLHLRIVG
jgi:hypothetical protein